MLQLEGMARRHVSAPVPRLRQWTSPREFKSPARPGTGGTFPHLCQCYGSLRERRASGRAFLRHARTRHDSEHQRARRLRVVPEAGARHFTRPVETHVTHPFSILGILKVGKSNAGTLFALTVRGRLVPKAVSNLSHGPLFFAAAPEYDRL